MLDRRVALGGDHARGGGRGAAAGPPASLGRHPDLASWATRSAMLAAGTLMIAAEALGVASAPMEGFDPAKVKEAFGVPDDHTVCCLVALGYAAERDPVPRPVRARRGLLRGAFGQPWTLGEPPAGGVTGPDRPRLGSGPASARPAITIGLDHRPPNDPIRGRHPDATGRHLRLALAALALGAAAPATAQDPKKDRPPPRARPTPAPRGRTAGG